MTKGLHKNSLQKGDNPHQWMIDDARMELIQQIKAEVERRKKAIHSTLFNDEYNDFLSFLSDLESEKSFKEPIDGVLYAAACGIKNKGQAEKSEKPMEHKDIDAEIGHWLDRLDDKYCMLVNHYSIQDVKDTARHFYELGRQSKKRELLPMIEHICVSCPEKVKAESSIDKFILENCTHCTIEHCPGMRKCYTSSNEQLQ